MANEPKAPKWARQNAERVETKAAHLVALLLTKDELQGVTKVYLAKALGISRWTLDRYLASLPEIEERVEQIRQAITDEHNLQRQEKK